MIWSPANFEAPKYSAASSFNTDPAIMRRCLITKPRIYAVFFGATLIYLIYFLSLNTTYLNDLAETKFGRTRYVLFWTLAFNKWSYFKHGYGFEPFKKCKYKNCFATVNRTLIPVEQFDALIFHAPSYNKKTHGVPWVRSSHQRYIYMNLESPLFKYAHTKEYNSFFNWTMTYRLDSDVVRRYGYVLKEKTNYTMPSKEVLGQKNGLAVWFVSNCHTESHRDKLVEELKKFVPVDVYGKCGDFQCRRENNSYASPQECYEMAEKKYKFYLSFENSYCRDYTTEKLYNILRTDLVPVVYGFDDYTLTAPPNAVINVADFESAGELASYLEYLDENVDAYLKYFEWKREYTIISFSENSACQLCQKLHEPLRESIYHDLNEWWWGKNNSMCKLGKALPKIVSSLLRR